MPTDPLPNSPKKRLDNYVRYSAMGLQMGAIIFLLTYAGIKLDAYLHLSFPAFTLFLALFSVVAALWYFIRDFIR
ncbi:hypothetical protein BH11BAC2_BH11BAC2_02510 [soil metagenome]